MVKLDIINRLPYISVSSIYIWLIALTNTSRSHIVDNQSENWMNEMFTLNAVLVPYWRLNIIRGCRARVVSGVFIVFLFSCSYTKDLTAFQIQHIAQLLYEFVWFSFSTYLSHRASRWKMSEINKKILNINFKWLVL